MSFEKFLGLLCDESLFLTRMDGFVDKWEGVLPETLVNASWKGPNGELMGYVVKESRKFFYVNCWHMSDVESAALWHLYGNSPCVAIQSTIGSLIGSISDDKTVYIGRVQYCDYDKYNRPPKKPFALMEPAFLKRRSFDHEKELRILHWEPVVKGKKPSANHKLSVKLNTLLNSVFISPTSPKWLEQYVRVVMNKFGMDTVPVNMSTLYDEHIG